MSTLRQKITGGPVIANWQEAEKVMARLAEITRTRRAQEAEIQTKIDRLKAELNEVTKELQLEQAQIEKNLEDFATYHKSEFEGNKGRSRDLTTGLIGFRKSPGKLATLKGWTWEKVLARITEMKRKAWIEEKKTVKKDTILAERRSRNITDDELAAYGISFQEPDEFFYEVRDVEAKSAAVYDMAAGGAQ